MNRDHIHISYHKSSIGELIIGSFAEKICIVDFRHRAKREMVDRRIRKGLRADFVERKDDVIQETKKHIDAYLAGTQQDFPVPILPVGSDFQKRVWRAIQCVPYGHTASYADIARKIGKPQAVRAVASATSGNAIALIIPCHRIIYTNGTIGNYAGGSATKEKLLELEKSSCLMR
ncbi:MAG: cysteine methyltransferase [Candidatus Moraniibacteriota bacterium]|nr:MAG: cysteine methyltransferase [Candidatus Moranbacteria bacterium]